MHGVPETLAHFACVCPQSRKARLARTSTVTQNQVQQVVSSFFSQCAGPNRTVYEKNANGKYGIEPDQGSSSCICQCLEIACGQFSKSVISRDGSLSELSFPMYINELP